MNIALLKWGKYTLCCFRCWVISSSTSCCCGHSQSGDCINMKRNVNLNQARYIPINSTVHNQLIYTNLASHSTRIIRIIAIERTYNGLSSIFLLPAIVVFFLIILCVAVLTFLTGFSHIQASFTLQFKLFHTLFRWMISVQCSFASLFGSLRIQLVKFRGSPLLQYQYAGFLLVANLYLSPIQKRKFKFFVWLYTKLTSSLLAREAKSAPLFRQSCLAAFQSDNGDGS